MPNRFLGTVWVSIQPSRSAMAGTKPTTISTAAAATSHQSVESTPQTSSPAPGSTPRTVASGKPTTSAARTARTPSRGPPALARPAVAGARQQNTEQWSGRALRSEQSAQLAVAQLAGQPQQHLETARLPTEFRRGTERRANRTGRGAAQPVKPIRPGKFRDRPRVNHP